MMVQKKLTLDEAKKRFASTSECFHDPDHFTEVAIPGTNVQITSCRGCNKEIERWYGHRSLGRLLELYITETKTRKQIYARFDAFSSNTIRGRLSDLKRENKIFSIEPDTFTPVEKKDV